MNDEDKKIKSEEESEKQLEECEKKCEEYLNNWKRERADFINYKKEELKRLDQFVKFANEGVILEILDLVDDIEIAAKEIKDHGLGQILKKFGNLLREYGIERIKTEGEKFNPLLHEAVETHSASSGQAEEGGEKVVEVRAGYTMYGKVIRPARIKIIK